MLSPSQLHDVVHVYLAEAKEDLAVAKQHENRFIAESQSLETLSLLALARKAVAQVGDGEAATSRALQASIAFQEGVVYSTARRLMAQNAAHHAESRQKMQEHQAKAIEKYRECAKLDPSVGEAWFNLGLLLEGQDPAAAQAAFLRVVELSGAEDLGVRAARALFEMKGATASLDAELFAPLTNLYLAEAKEDLAVAKQHENRFIAESQSLETLSLLALARKAVAQVGDGEAVTSRALQASIAFQEGVVYSTARRLMAQNAAHHAESRQKMQEHQAKAIEKYRECAKLDPSVGEAWFNLGLLLEGQDPAAAQAAFLRVVELSGAEDLGVRAARALFEMKGATASLDAELFAPLTNLYLAEAKEDLAVAKQHENRFIAESQSLETLSLLALARKAVAQVGDGEAVTSRALQASIAFQEGVVYSTARRLMAQNAAHHAESRQKMQEHQAKAIEKYRECAKLDPSVGEAWFNLGLLLEGQDPAAAQAAFLRVVELSGAEDLGVRAARALFEMKGATASLDAELFAPLTNLYLAEAKEDLAVAKQHENRFIAESQSLETLSLLALARKAVAQVGDGEAVTSRALQASIAFQEGVVYSTARRLMAQNAAHHAESRQKMQEHQAKAIEKYRECAKLDPSVGEAWFNLGLLLEGQDPAAAQAAFLRVVELSGAEDLGVRAARALFEMKGATASLDAELFAPLTNLYLAEAKEDLAVAKQHENRFIAESQSLETLSLLALARKAVAQVGDGEAATSRALQASIAFQEGVVYSTARRLMAQNAAHHAESRQKMQEHQAKAIEKYRECAKLDPSVGEAWFNLGLLLLPDKDSDAAEALAEVPQIAPASDLARRAARLLFEIHLRVEAKQKEAKLPTRNVQDNTASPRSATKSLSTVSGNQSEKARQPVIVAQVGAYRRSALAPTAPSVPETHAVPQQPPSSALSAGAERLPISTQKTHNTPIIFGAIALGVVVLFVAYQASPHNPASIPGSTSSTRPFLPAEAALGTSPASGTPAAQPPMRTALASVAVASPPHLQAVMPQTQQRVAEGQAGTAVLKQPSAAVEIPIAPMAGTEALTPPPSLADTQAVDSDAAAWDILRSAESAQKNKRDIAREANNRGYRLLNTDQSPERALPFFDYAAKLDSKYGMPRYNAAKCLMARNDIDRALRYLEEIKQMGRAQRERLLAARTDPAFEPIQTDPRFTALFE